MNRYYLRLAISTAVSALIFTGCGGGGGPSDIQTGTGFYLDEAVIGAEYKCGAKTGSTEDGGKFTFEVGQDCKFEIAGIKLRSMKASELSDGIKVVENDPKVAAFLQSIDKDGDPKNGITITKEVADALKKLIDDGTITKKSVPVSSDLEAVVTHLRTDVKDFDGKVVTPEKAMEHVKETQSKVTKSLIAGKTLYIVYFNDQGSDAGKVVTKKIVVNSDATSITEYDLNGKKEGSTKITLDGNKLTFEHDDDGSYTLLVQKGDYIHFDNRHADGSKDGQEVRAYSDVEKAKAYAKEYQSELEKYAKELVGKTIYEKECDGSINSSELNRDGKIYITEANGEKGSSEYKIEGNKLYTIEGNEKELHILAGKTDTTVIFYETDNNEYTTFYLSKDIALKAKKPSEDCRNNHEGDENNHKEFSIQEINGKTYYLVVNDDFGDSNGRAWNMAKIEFFSDREMNWQEYDTSDTASHTLPYSIENGKIKIDTDSSDSGIISITKEAEESDYIRVDFDGAKGYLFMDEAKARAKRDSLN